MFILNEDNEHWRGKIDSITFLHDSGETGDITSIFDLTQVGKLVCLNYFGEPGTYTFTIVANGYEDVVILVDVLPALD